MSSIILDNIYKHYQLYANDYQRLREIITGKSTADVIKALDPVTMKIEKGQVVGIVGNNGAGKSTLLKLISGTTHPTGGTLEVNGRIAALLELGTGFHPELTGHENIYLYGAILGISKSAMEALYEDIVDFSGIENFIHQPVKTYSSGMFVRLAFSVATSVDPDILIIDEALSVGDGNFARKSFDRIMKFKESGKTILFCSHSMFHIESICDRAIWIEEGQIKMDGEPAAIVSAYNATMKMQHSDVHSIAKQDEKIDDKQSDKEQDRNTIEIDETHAKKLARFINLEVQIDEQKGNKLKAQSGDSTLSIKAEFESDCSIQIPTFAITITDENDFNVSSACSLIDKYNISRDTNGISKVELSFPKINLLKGQYHIYAYLMCERCIFIYEQAPKIAKIEVTQQFQELGIVRLPHVWNTGL